MIEHARRRSSSSLIKRKMKNSSQNSIQIKLRFYGNLNELINRKFSDTEFTRVLPEPTSVKDLIEGCGVPHTEADLILVDRLPADYNTLVKGGEFVSVYPNFGSLELPEKYKLQYSEVNHERFLVDVNLGKLSRYLRIAGFDAAYDNNAKDPQLINKMQRENRVLLTRDKKLLMHSVVKHGYLVRSAYPDEQLEEVFERFILFGKVDPYSRCIHCNTVLMGVSKETVINELEPLTKKYFNRFSQCPECKQIYWRGSHRQRLKPKVKKLLSIDHN